MAIVQRGLTLDEFLTWPEQKPALEYLDGVVTPKMSPKGPHGGLQAELAYLFKAFVRQHPIAEVFTELRTSWSDRASLIPDLSVYLVERIPTKPNGEVADDFWEPPDVAVEIASPGQSVRDLTNRAELLIENGVRIVVVVEPARRRVRVARPDQPIASYQGDDAVDLGDILPGFSFVVRDLFASIQVRGKRRGTRDE
jgi:Uma2 family endonuclease